MADYVYQIFFVSDCVIVKMCRNVWIVVIASLCLPALISAFNFVVIRHETTFSHSNRVRRDSNSEANLKPVINELRIASKVASRFASTSITSELENEQEQDLEARFVVQIPETAFISNFSMIIDGKEQVAEVPYTIRGIT